MGEVPQFDDEQVQQSRIKSVKRVRNFIIWAWVVGNGLFLLPQFRPAWANNSNGEHELSFSHLSTLNQRWAYPVAIIDMVVLIVLMFWVYFIGLPYYLPAFWRSYVKTGSFRIWQQELEEVQSEAMKND